MGPNDTRPTRSSGSARCRGCSGGRAARGSVRHRIRLAPLACLLLAAACAPAAVEPAEAVAPAEAPAASASHREPLDAAAVIGCYVGRGVRPRYDVVPDTVNGPPFLMLDTTTTPPWPLRELPPGRMAASILGWHPSGRPLGRSWYVDGDTAVVTDWDLHPVEYHVRPAPDGGLEGRVWYGSDIVLPGSDRKPYSPTATKPIRLRRVPCPPIPTNLPPL